jgi:hypothetical protein
VAGGLARLAFLGSYPAEIGVVGDESLFYADFGLADGAMKHTRSYSGLVLEVKIAAGFGRV